MEASALSQFGISQDIVLLNHASYGVATSQLRRHTAEIRDWIDSDPIANLGRSLLPRLETISNEFHQFVGLGKGTTVLTHNGTDALASLLVSMDLNPGDRVGVLSTEYPAVHRAWQVGCEKAGAIYVNIEVDLPVVSATDVVDRILAAGPLQYLQISVIASESSMVFPFELLDSELAKLDSRPKVFADAAHAPGQLDLQATSAVCDVVFGGAHKWIPVPRTVGFIWASESCDFDLMPNQVSLNWDADSARERFGWPGTFDPATRLCLPAAIAQWKQWNEAGLLQQVETLARGAAQALQDVGAVAAVPDNLVAPRMFSCLLRGVSAPAARQKLETRNIRAWSNDGEGEAVLRVAFNIYNNKSDVDLLAHTVAELFAESTQSGQ